MENKAINIALVTILGVVLGVGIVTQQSKQPMIRELLIQQKTILDGQNRIENKIGFGSGADSSQLKDRIGALETKVARLEGQLAGLDDIKDKMVNIAGNAVAQRPTQAAPTPPPPAQKVDIPIEHSYIIGKKNAPVSIVEFVDFQCPYCARFHPPIKEVLEAMPNDVNLIIKNFPLSFHPQARPAAYVAFAAGEQGKYEEMTDLILSSGRNLNDETYEKFAKDLGLDMKKFSKDRADTAKWDALIEKDMELGSKVGVRGTPTIFVDGKQSRSRDVASYTAEIKEILKDKK